MSEFRLIFETDNAAFTDLLSGLQQVMQAYNEVLGDATIDELMNGITVKDMNGNSIGRMQYIERGK